MTENSVIDALKSLVISDENRSAASRLFAMIDEIETAFSAGVSRSAVLQVLNDHGFKMTLKSFDSTLHRARKKRGKLAIANTATTSATPATSNPLTTEKPVVPAAEQAKVQIEKPVVQTTMPVPTPGKPLTLAEMRIRRKAVADMFVKEDRISPIVQQHLDRIKLEKLKKEQDK